jgi:hypothetical protein
MQKKLRILPTLEEHFGRRYTRQRLQIEKFVLGDHALPKWQRCWFPAYRFLGRKLEETPKSPSRLLFKPIRNHQCRSSMIHSCPIMSWSAQTFSSSSNACKTGAWKILDHSVDITPERIDNTVERLARLDALADTLAAGSRATS